MRTTFDSLSAFRKELQRARSVRDGHAAGLAQRWHEIQVPEVRKALIKNSAVDAIRGSALGRHIHDLVSAPLVSSLAPAAAALYAGTQRSVVKRMLISVAGLLVSRTASKDKDGPGALDKLASGIGAFRDRLRERKAARERSAQAHESMAHPYE
jgi:hypothetical protein